MSYIFRCVILVVLSNNKNKLHGTYRVIQEESAILWEMIVCDSKQKSSYEHGSNFGWLRSYGHLLIPVYALV